MLDLFALSLFVSFFPSLILIEYKNVAWGHNIKYGVCVDFRVGGGYYKPLISAAISPTAKPHLKYHHI